MNPIPINMTSIEYEYYSSLYLTKMVSIEEYWGGGAFNYGRKVTGLKLDDLNSGHRSSSY